ncbi:MAG: S1 family peptidase, partial [Myxococcales bacterium]|nr:S1 family peptidase [Myxococcales bacterium]
DLVLTAAHCFGDGTDDPSGILVLTGDSEDEPSQVLSVADYGMHPEFCNPVHDPTCADQRDIYDFAWVRLAAPVIPAPDPLPVVIVDPALHHRLIRAGAELVLVGYGQDDRGQLGTKREVTTDIDGFTAAGLEFRAGGHGRDSCFGDSGGPAFARLDDGRLALAGVLSRGGECGEGGLYGVPFPELCWLRDSSGTDFLPAGCAACDCVALFEAQEQEEGCGCVSASPVGAGDGEGGGLALALAELGLLGLFGLRRRRRRR